MGFLIAYLAGIVVWALVSGMNYGINRSFGWSYQRQTKFWARMLMASPVWPVGVLVLIWFGLVKIYNSLKDAYIQADLDDVWEKVKKK